MTIAVFTLIVGLLFAGGGGELFVRGTVGLAQAARVSPGIIAATIASFATSSPELTVAVSSALEGTPQISLGDALGSNVVNIALILGLALLMAPLSVPRASVRRDLPVVLLVPILLAALLFDGRFSRLDAVLLLAGFAIWMTAIVAEVRAQRSAAPEVIGDPNKRRAILESVVGLLLLIAAGKLIVHGASVIATNFGVSQFAIGATVVALGTSVPELATTIIARMKRHDEVGLGTLLGSNIFNGLFIVSVAAAITPYDVQLGAVAPALLLGSAAVALTWPPRSGTIGSWRGGLLLAVYVTFVVVALAG